MFYLRVVILSALVLAPPLVYAQGFIGNCSWKTATLVESYLGMYCNDDDWEDYNYDWTWLDTANCLTNSDGQLVAQDSGDYWTSCKGCSVLGSTINFVLNCTCLWAPGKVTTSTYDLNRIIGNYNGSLFCFDHVGNKTQLGPF